MNRGGVVVVVAVLLLLFLGQTCLVAGPAGVRSVGLRLHLPFGSIPLSIGGEVTFDAAFGALAFSLLLSPTGGSLLMGSADWALSADPATAKMFLRLTAGLAYFEPVRQLPTPVVGAGTVVRWTDVDPFFIALSGEAIYPIAFPTPMFAVSGGWALP